MTAAPTVALVDMGLGNLRSVLQSLERAGARVSHVDKPTSLAAFDRIVVPGQGAFAGASDALGRGFGDALLEAFARKQPYLGICLGMQMLFESSAEAPGKPGLGVMAGTVRRLEPAPGIKIPHMGWNQLASAHPWFEDAGWYYFVHSFHCVPGDDACVAATTEHGQSVCAAVAADSIVATQFHPEKSHAQGAAFLKRFLLQEATCC